MSMIYNETGSGGTANGGSVFPTVLYPVPTRFVPGEALFNVAKARRGVLEKVIVKLVRTVTNKRTLGSNRVLYIDTFNALWNEYDLVRPDEAYALVAAHCQKLSDQMTNSSSC